jgi:signal transduction histidine kinase
MDGESVRGRSRDTMRNFFSVSRPGSPPEPGRWILAVDHPSGSLEAAVSAARRKNLGISLAILVLLVLAVVSLLISTQRAQRLARQQMAFVAGVSHELKTPLTAMRSAGQNLADGIVDTPEKVRKYGALVEREGRRLTEMVGRVLTLAGIQSGSQTLQMQPVSVSALVEGALSDSRWVLEEKKVQFETRLDDALPEVRGDATALRQALTNLVDNALKYGGGAKWIGLDARVATTSSGNEVVLAVSDRGIGIRRSDLSRLFEPFFRSADPLAAGTSGSGLGLAVVRGIVEAHGGRVTAESVPGKGSTFAIHLPVAASPAGTGAAA